MRSFEKVAAPVSKPRAYTRLPALVTLMCFVMVAGVVAPSSATNARHRSTRGDAPEFDNQAVVTTSAPSITIVEDAVPNAAQDFPFSGCQGASCSVFALDDDADPALPNTVSASGLTAGTYTITQAPGVNHWVLDDIFCDTGENVDVENRTVTITLGATEDVTCTFLNRSPSIRITEDALPDAPQDFSFTGCQGASCGTFVLDDDTDPVLTNSVTASGLAPGTYTITQAPTANWSLDSLSCTTGEVVDLVNRRVTITLGADEFAKCTFTNRTTGIRVVQDTIPDDPQDFGFTSCLGSGCGHFTLDDDGDPTLANSVTGAGLAPGTYTITQDITPGFDLVYIGCGGDPSNRRLTLDLEPTQAWEACTFVNRPTPPPLTNVAQISTGSENTTCARLTIGEVRCWGWNFYGWLGTGSSDEYLSIPTTVLNPEGTGPLTDVVQVSVGNRHACAVLQNGEGRCWGANYSGQLGNGTTDTYATRPVAVLNPSGTGPLTGIAQITAGSLEQTCARLTNGEARCWGRNGSGQLGNGTTTISALPVVVSNPDGTGPLTDVAQISTGVDHSCARLSNGEGRCWGANGNGELGNGTDVSSTRPVVVLNPSGTGPLTGIAQITAGSRTCARVGRQARCWGGGTGSRLPVVVLDSSGEAPLTNVAEVTAAGYGRSCARLLNGEARCWGSSLLGDGTQDYSDLPVVVSNPDGTGPLTDVAQISTGSFHSCARLSNGEARCWGANGGQLGNGTPNGDIPGGNYTRPVVVISP